MRDRGALATAARVKCQRPSLLVSEGGENYSWCRERAASVLFPTCLQSPCFGLSAEHFNGCK